MDLSVVILCYRGWNHLEVCLDSLLEAVKDLKGIEVIVADNNSGDGKVDEFAARYPSFRFISNQVNGGFAYGCNRGADVATGEYLLFLNPDTVINREALVILLDTARKNPDAFITSCRQVNGNGKESKAWGPFLGPGKLTGTGRLIARIFGAPGYKKGKDPEYFYPDWVSGSVIAIRRDVFSKLSGFDEDYWMYYEDMDICRRARNAGGKVLFTNSCTVVHSHGGSSRINLLTTSLTKSQVLVSRHIYISKHFGKGSAVFFQAWIVLINIISLVLKSLPGLILFFVPRLAVPRYILARIVSYYFKAFRGRTWISPLSVNYKK